MDAEKIELSPAEAITALNWKKSKVYYWIKLGKFETVERIDGQKILLSRADIERLKKNTADAENIENSEIDAKTANNSENLESQTVLNAAKNCEKEPQSLNPDILEFFQKTLNAVQQMQQAASINYNNSLKLLTDGQSNFEKEYFAVKAEAKSSAEKLKKFEKDLFVKNTIIVILTAVLISAGLFIVLFSKSLMLF